MEEEAIKVDNGMVTFDTKKLLTEEEFKTVLESLFKKGRNLLDYKIDILFKAC